MRHLRLLDTSHASEVASLLGAACDSCERDCERTLRVDVTRVLTMADWWSCDLWLPWPPLRSITSVKYYDTEGAQQTLGAGNYYVESSTNGKGRLAWAADADIPSLEDREDAVEVTFVTGYASVTDVPATAIHAIKTRLTELWGDGRPEELKAAADCASRLLAKVGMPTYA